MKAVGARLPRYDGIEHVTGRTTYVDDVRVPGMLWAKALRSPLHSATITSFDASKAEAMPGVHAVITHADVPLLEYGHLSALGIPADPTSLTVGGIVAAAVALVVGLVGAVLGGLAGMRYHRKIDRATPAV